MHYDHLSDEEVFAFIEVRRDNERRTVAEIVALLAVVEDRRIHLARAFTSMFDYCLRGLGLTEKEAKRRIDAARIVARFPESFEALASGSVCLSSFVLLKDVLTRDNVADLLARAAGKTQLEVGMLVAGLAPKPDLPPSITALPEPSGGSESAPCFPPLTPLSPGRYKVELTGDEAFRTKMMRGLELSREENFSGDLLVMFDAALDLFIAYQEKKKRKKTSRPRASKGSKDSGAVIAAVRREVFARDNEQCMFVSEDGVRCPARAMLQIDHRHARARGGEGAPANLRVLCKPHNAYEAERAFGREHIAKKIAERRLGAAAKREAVRADVPAEKEAVRADVPAERACAPLGREAADQIEGTRAKLKSGLVRLGFRAKPVDTTLDGLTEWERPLEDLMREAIRRLTS